MSGAKDYLRLIGQRPVAGWDGPGASTALLVRRERSVGSGQNQKFVAEYKVDTGLLRELRKLEKQAAIELGQWTEKRDVKLDANVRAEAKILAASFTLEELERMMDTVLKAVEQREQQQQQGAVSSAVLPAAEAVAEIDAKTTESAELDPVLPLSPGRIERHGFEYYRHGTLSLYAALDVESGKVHGKTAAHHTSDEFVEFQGQVMGLCPPEQEIHIIIDNLSAHKTKKVS
jgi:hypothetical protein